MTTVVLARLGRDAEVRFTAGGDPVASLSLAYSYGKRDPGTGKRAAQWVDAALYGARAEALAPYLTKGSAVVATLTDLHIEIYDKRDGTAAAKLVARVADIELAGGGDPSERKASAPASAPPRREPAPVPRPTPGRSTGFDDMDDDIPF